jgi:hypothetical protein
MHYYVVKNAFSIDNIPTVYFIISDNGSELGIKTNIMQVYF